MGYDKFMRPEVVEKRKATAQLMDEIYPELSEYINKTEMPMHIVPKIQKLGINGFLIKDHGGPGFTNLEAGAIIYEVSKRDCSISTFILLHTAIGSNVVSLLGDQE